jgi:hypothetical protein
VVQFVAIVFGSFLLSDFIPRSGWKRPGFRLLAAVCQILSSVWLCHPRAQNPVTTLKIFPGVRIAVTAAEFSLLLMFPLASSSVNTANLLAGFSFCCRPLFLPSFRCGFRDCCFLSAGTVYLLEIHRFSFDLSPAARVFCCRRSGPFLLFVFLALTLCRQI